MSINVTSVKMKGLVLYKMSKAKCTAMVNVSACQATGVLGSSKPIQIQLRKSDSKSDLLIILIFCHTIQLNEYD